MNRFVILLAGWILPLAIFAQPWKNGAVKPSSDGHHLVHSNGKAFFWLADTDWEMFHRLTLPEAETLIKTRKKQHFNVLQAVALAEFDGLRKPNAYGQTPFEGADPSKPNEAYWKTVDDMIDLAAKHGLYVALLPTWGDKVTQMWGEGPVVFPADQPEIAYRYATWLAERYKKHPNVLWMLGGDRPPLTDEKRPFSNTANVDYRPVWRAMAKGILEKQPDAFITYHIWGGEQSTSQYIHEEPWLHMNTIQSGHGGGHDVTIWKSITRDYQLKPVKPTLDAEPNYEDHPVNPWPKWDPATGYYNDYDVRKQCYRSVFAGGCGVTYGHHAVWQFWSPRYEKINHADRYWTEAIYRPGANQIGYLRQLIESRPMLQRIPDQSLIAEGQGNTAAEYICATRAADGSYAFVYLPVAKQITMETKNLKGDKIAVRWYNPRTGKMGKKKKVKKAARIMLKPPVSSDISDWVLILDAVK